MKQRSNPIVTTAVAVLVLLAAGAGASAFVYSGWYNIGADAPHTRPVYALMKALRDRSIAAHSADIAVPDLSNPALILKGAGQYAAMCTQCHLTPAMSDSEIRPGLYPQPPNLSRVRVDPRAAFWVIKHGIKMSAMPAWGRTHDDDTIWSMVAFLQKLPDMTAQQYADIVARAPPDEDMDMGDGDGTHSHHHAATVQHHDGAGTQPLSFDGLHPGAAPQAEAAASAFHQALQRGDRGAVLDMFTDDVRISEGGHTQTRDAYAQSHLDQDIAFLQGATVSPLPLVSAAAGDTAVVGSESTITREDGGKSQRLQSRERLDLRRQDGHWKISAIQWQSLPVPSP